MSSRRRNFILTLGAIALLLTPISIWVLWKPIRALAPEWGGVTCYPGGICTDDSAKLSEAVSLKNEAMAFVAAWAGPFSADPRMIFCTTAACEKHFGFSGNAAYNLGVSALVVSSRGWKPYYVRHELIHCVQVERIGGFRMLLHTPAWLIEGMAYSASKDPRRPLQEPWETYRKKYEVWARRIPAEALWLQASEQ